MFSSLSPCGIESILSRSQKSRFLTNLPIFKYHFKCSNVLFYFFNIMKVNPIKFRARKSHLKVNLVMVCPLAPTDPSLAAEFCSGDRCAPCIYQELFESWFKSFVSNVTTRQATLGLPLYLYFYAFTPAPQAPHLLFGSSKSP